MPVQEGRSSNSSGPAAPEDVEESALVKKLVAQSAPTAADWEEHTASGHAVFRIWCRECLRWTWPNASRTMSQLSWPEGIHSDFVEVGRCEESALYDSQSNGLGESAVKDVKDAVRTNLACLVRRFGREFRGGHPVLPW